MRILVRLLKSFAWAFVAAIAAGIVWVIVVIGFGLDQIVISGSGGLGAVSAGFSEALIEAGGVVFVVVFVWRLWKTRRRATRTAR